MKDDASWVRFDLMIRMELVKPRERSMMARCAALFKRRELRRLQDDACIFSLVFHLS